MHRGTIAELTGKLSINGVVLDQPTLSTLTRIGRGLFCRPVGKVPPAGGGRGKPATIWEFNTSPRFSIEAVAVEATGEEINADDSTVECTVAGVENEDMAVA